MVMTMINMGRLIMKNYDDDYKEQQDIEGGFFVILAALPLLYTVPWSL